MHDRNVQPVDYQRSESPHASRKAIRWMLFLTLLNSIMLGIALFGPKTWPYFKNAYAQWKDERNRSAANKIQIQKDIAAQGQAVSFALPEKTVVYEENWEEAVKLLRSNQGYIATGQVDPNRPSSYQLPVMLPNPLVYKDLTYKINGGSRFPAAMTFLHERTTSSGVKMLVAVELTSLPSFRGNGDLQTKGRRLWTSAWLPTPNGIQVPAKFQSSMEILLPDSDHIVKRDDVTKDRGNEFRLLAGVVDPKDASRFVIPFVVDGKEGQIVGQLTDQGVVLTPSIGRATYGSGLDVTRWKLVET
ncbi:MAG TPA: hypothetical protein VL282_17145, partial [Tepidisphaeraceae bacterium]|nr:hypothetical protein [Tepidisphaeraceae bacterium]